MDLFFKGYIANLFKTKDVEGYENLQKRISNNMTKRFVHLEKKMEKSRFLEMKHSLDKK